MAINFEKKQEDTTDVKKIILILFIIVLVVAIYFLFFKKDDNTIIQNMNNNAFAPINIDFTFISSEEINNLKEFKGIPVLPGFYTASDKQIQPEKIDYGREDPFKEVTKGEIELAIFKLIARLEEEQELEELKQSIVNSTLYNTSQKKVFIKSIEDKIKSLKEEKEEGMEIVIESPEEQTEEQTEDPLNFKVW